MLDQVRGNIDQIVDLQYLAVSTLVRNKQMLNTLLRETSRKAMRFVRRTGVIFGFAIGLIQMIAWGVIHSVWIMPVFGFVTGFFSDWLALTMLFRPEHPKRYFGVFRWQGMLHSEREEITKDYAKITANDLFSPAVLMEGILTGPGSDRLFAMIQREVAQALDQEAGIAQPLVQLTVGTTRYQELKQTVARRVIERIPETAQQVEDLAKDMFAVEETISEKMRLLSADEYEAILRPVFKDDEWLVITMGALLGFFVGELQVTLVTHFGGA
jgi:uncharacterized membrane protein YheB (UPF0754 family)